jgi:hypothetical protein
MDISAEKRAELIEYIRVWYPDWQDFHHATFQKNEIEYKRSAAAKVQELLPEPALRELLQTQNYAEIVQRLKRAAQAANLLYVAAPAKGDLRVLYQEGLDQAAFTRQVYDLLYGPDASEERLQRYLDFCAAGGLGEYWTFPTYYLYFCHPDSDIFVKPEVTHTFWQLLERGFAWPDRPSAAAYGAIKEMARAVIQCFADLGARDMIDAHGVIWTCGRVVRETVVAKEKRAEFAELFAQFLDEYPPSPAGQTHISLYDRCRAAGRANYDEVERRSAAGEDVTDFVLLKLLPYVDNEPNRKRGAWIHYAPVIRSDLRKYHESRWAKPEDWPATAQAIHGFVRQCVEHPDRLGDACREFSQSPYAKGYQTGMLSPILYALDGEHFSLINNKTRAVLNYLAGKSYQQNIADYPPANRAYLGVLAELSPTLEQGQALGLRNADLFDMFCHWLVAVKRYSFKPIRYWKIAPGENARFWNDWQEGGFVAIGWDKLGDLNSITRNDFLRRVDHLGQDDDEYNKQACEQAWKFARQIGEGDHVLANQGTKKVLALGRVTGPYYFVPGVEYGHRLPLEWYDLTMRAVDEGGWRQTLVNLPKEKFDEIAGIPPAEPAPGGDPVADPGPGDPPSTLQGVYTLAQMAAETGYPEIELERWVRAVERKKQAVLYGPPGTGKTYLAERLARHLVGGGDGLYQVVQFHPAFAYEDFVQGIRPKTNADGGLEYAVVPGRFVEFCMRVREKSGISVLIIDEINRANLARVFGELMYLMEYRDLSVPLAAGGEPFSIPENLRILGTMNTADRSIALVDHALRRRFAFIPLPPSPKALLAFHQRHNTGFPVQRLIDILNALNKQINDHHYSVGISFFMQRDLQSSIEDIWRMEIEPYLEEYFFDRPDAANNFR